MHRRSNGEVFINERKLNKLKRRRNRKVECNKSNNPRFTGYKHKRIYSTSHVPLGGLLLEGDALLFEVGAGGVQILHKEAHMPEPAYLRAAKKGTTTGLSVKKNQVYIFHAIKFQPATPHFGRFRCNI